MCFDFLYNFGLNHFSFYEEMSEIWSKMYFGLTVKYPLFLSDFNETWSVLDRFSKHPQISNFIKIRHVDAELFHADGQKDRHDEANGGFSQFYERA